MNITNGGKQMSKITNVITLKQYADKHELDLKRLRRTARKNEFPGDVQPFKFGDTNGRGGVWAIDATAPAIVLPDKSARGTRRPDGRQRYIVYMNVDELHEFRAWCTASDTLIDPRTVAKSRRDARKLADAVAANVDDDDDGNGNDVNE